MDSGDLLKEPADFVAKLERERDALKARNHTMCDGLKRLVARASSSVDFMLPALMEEVARCTLEGLNAKARLALAVAQGDAPESVAALKKRVSDLDAELQTTRKLQADASRLIPLIDEMRSFSGVPAPCAIPPEKIIEGQMKMPEKCPLRVFRLETRPGSPRPLDPTRRLLEHIKESGAGNPPSLADGSLAGSPEEMAEAGSVALKLKSAPAAAAPSATTPPERDQPFKRSLFGKLVSFR